MSATKSLDEFSDESDYEEPCEKSESEIVSTNWNLKSPKRLIIKDCFVKLEKFVRCDQCNIQFVNSKSLAKHKKENHKKVNKVNGVIVETSTLEVAMGSQISLQIFLHVLYSSRNP